MYLKQMSQVSNLMSQSLVRKVYNVPSASPPASSLPHSLESQDSQLVPVPMTIFRPGQPLSGLCVQLLNLSEVDLGLQLGGAFDEMNNVQKDLQRPSPETKSA